MTAWYGGIRTVLAEGSGGEVFVPGSGDKDVGWLREGERVSVWEGAFELNSEE